MLAIFALRPMTLVSYTSITLKNMVEVEAYGISYAVPASVELADEFIVKLELEGELLLAMPSAISMTRSGAFWERLIETLL